MRYVAIIGFKSNGTAELLDCSTNPGASPESVARAFHAYRVDGSLPAGVAVARLLDSDRGQTAIAFPKGEAPSDKPKGKLK